MAAAAPRLSLSWRPHINGHIDGSIIEDVVTPSNKTTVAWGSPGLVAPFGGFGRQHHARHIPPRSSGNADATSCKDEWVCALEQWRRAGTVKEAVASLNRLEAAPIDAEAHVAAVHNAQFQQAVNFKRMEAPSLFVYKVEEAVAVITSHLLRSSEPAASLPPGLFLDIAQFLTLEERGKAVCCVSRKWRQLGEHNHLWREPYLTRFKFHSPQEDLATHTEAQELAQPGPKVKDLFARRLVRPQVGDRVEVAWRGKFRLESLEIYNGLAWWLAEIVECDADGQRYKVHYPGWEARWDEFVPRERLRWGNDRRAAQLRDERIAVGDMVEIWCGGTNVPGAWLEGRVSSIRGERVFLGDVVAEGFFSVTEERCRLVSKGASAPPQSEGRSDTARALCNIARQSCGCSVM